MKPDRIIIGECIGDEALDILRMMEAGHNVMFTMGSCHPENAVYGLRLLMRLAKRDMSEKEALKMIAKNMDLIIHVVNKRIVAVAEVGGITEDGTLGLFDVFNYKIIGETKDGAYICKLRPTGYIPVKSLDKAERNGVHIPKSIFTR